MVALGQCKLQRREANIHFCLCESELRLLSCVDDSS